MSPPHFLSFKIEINYRLCEKVGHLIINQGRFKLPDFFSDRLLPWFQSSPSGN